MTPSESLQEWIERAREGDLNAQYFLYQKYAPRIYALCVAYTGDRQEAEDLLHDIFFRVLISLSQLEHPERFEGWLRQIAIRTIIDHLRKRQRLVRWIDLQNTDSETAEESIPEPADPEQSPESILEEVHHQELLRLIHRLPEGARTAFLLHVVEGYSHKEIARKLGISEGTSKSQVARARSLLRKWLQKWLRR